MTRLGWAKGALAATLLVACPRAASLAVTLEQIVSREDPSFNVSSARLTVGRDGMVYLCSGGNNSFVLRVSRDGKDKLGGRIVYAAHNATANADGVIASANAHFAHKVALYGKELRDLASVGEFLVSDQVGWDAPAHVEAGASGDFYGVDQHRDRILRISPTGKLLRAYPLPHEPAGGTGMVHDFRVNEKLETFHVLNNAGAILCVGFDGKKRWELRPGVGGSTWGGTAGGWDVDDLGVLYAVEPRGQTVRKFSPDGRPAGQIELQMGDLKPNAQYQLTGLRVAGQEIVIKRSSPTELLQCYDLAAGALRGVVGADHERLTVELASETWTAGDSVGFRLDFDGGGRRITPRWRVWARPFHNVDYRELTVAEGKLRVPADAAGLYVVKVTPETQPWQRGAASEYMVRTVVEVRQPGAKGSATAMTPLNRVQFGRGEEIPFSVVVRAAKAGELVPIAVRLTDGKATFAEGQAEVRLAEAKPGATGAASFTLPKSLTAGLRPGRYSLIVSAPEMTCVPQPLEIGPGAQRGALGAQPPALHAVQYGDYGETFPSAGVWEAPEIVTADVARKLKLGFDLFVDRLGCQLQIGHVSDQAFRRAASEVADVQKRLAADPLAVAPEKIVPAPPTLQTMAGYSAAGVQQMAILMYNDAGLPLGTGFDRRKPEELVEAIRTVTKALQPFPAFRGWSWSSNWWVFDQRGSKAAATAEEKAAYDAALKMARETGKWDPVLDTVSARRLGYAVEAQELFRKALYELDKNLITAVACPFRNVEAHPPITLSNVDETDLQAQWEQIAVPFHAPYNVDFYKRPGKRAWGHPEIWNDCGTGDQVVPTLMQMLMRGADGVGASGPVPPWSSPDTLPDDPRSAHYGTASVFRALNKVLHRYGPWLATLENGDPVAIVASGRMFKIDDWGAGVMGIHFARLFEAYISCLAARLPASVVFAEDVEPNSLNHFGAILIVGQRVELEGPLSEALKRAKAAGAAVLHDGTCRPELVREYTPLGIAFDKVEKDPNTAGDDAAYLRFRDYARANAPALKAALKPVARPVGEASNDEVLLVQRKAKDGICLFVVNNTMQDLPIGQMWRMNLFLTSRVPVQVPIRLTGDAKAVYDVFAMKLLSTKDGIVKADLRSLPARIFAILPAPIAQVELSGPRTVKAGQRLAWSVRVIDKWDRTVKASVPIRVRLLAPDGAVLEERFLSADPRGGGGILTAPLLTTPKGKLALEATELFSGRSATLDIRPAAVEPMKLTAQPAPPRAPLAPATTMTLGRRAADGLEPLDDSFGAHIRDIVVADDGKLIVCNTMNWDYNLYGVRASDGDVRWRRRAGGYFAFAPQPLRDGFAVQGFDFRSAEGYHLYLGDEFGRLERRFALYGLPKRLPHRFVPGILADRINSFAVPEDGRWVASAGDLGLAVWSREGRLLWSEDWWKSQRHTARLAAIGADTLLAIEGMKATAYAATAGKPLWHLPLARTGETTDIRVSHDTRTIAILATTDGGRVFLLRDGKLVRTLPTPANDVGLPSSAPLIAVVTRNLLKLYSLDDGLQWTFSGDDNLRFPRFSLDDKRLVVTSDLGTVYVLDTHGKLLFEKDLGARAVPAWLPKGDLILGTWMGTLCRLNRKYAEDWRTLLEPDVPDRRDRTTLPEEQLPSARIASWGNAEGTPAVIAPNLLTQTKALIKFVPSSGWGGWAQLMHDPALLYDGKPDPPTTPWIAWDKVGFFAETSKLNYLLIDAFRTQLRLTAITLFEDPRSPESWLRDARLDYWDAATERWMPAAELLSNAPVHTHKLPKPIEAARFRIIMPEGLYGNLGLGEIVFHGEALGPSHPDVIARRPVAVLFDDGEDLQNSLVQPRVGLTFKLEGAYSGGRCLSLDRAASVFPTFQQPFGHTIPNWDFEIAENPQPGQYRYLQFAWRATASETKGIALRIGGASIYAGAGALFEGAPVAGAPAKKLADAPPRHWQVVTVDLWELFKKPVRLRAMDLVSAGGPAAFDQILLKRTDDTVPPLKN